ncbi:hypothetical protein GGF48_001521 [Coemansia sp. RSA 921]|nr:hypothetical protein GGF48_001521 [Coemansia sp. RSA 921]KAJ2262462.1 hypothetical protein EV176_006458 [Coemansia sp. RSA 451]KAJ2515342.1 hypothetical protein GGH20_004932 [Coemansia sp. RSA 1937]
MKFAIVSLVFAAVVLAQGELSTPPAAESTVAPVESTVAPAESTGEQPAGTPAETPMPQISMPSTHVGTNDPMSLISRLMSYFDFTRMDVNVASAPVIMATVYDPTTNKFTTLSAHVMQSGDAYYVPVCSTDSIIAAGEVPVMTQDATCRYGIQLTPMPSNAASTLYSLLRTKLRLILSLAKPSFWGMSSFRPSINMGEMMAQPDTQTMNQ